jgi:FkbM family methyltransferase
VVERLVANEKVEGSTPFARSNIVVIKSKYITLIFQKFLNDRDIQLLKKNFFYYLIFRVIRRLLSHDLIIQIYNFKVFGSINKNKTSYFLLKKCEFGDYHELNTIKKFSKKNKLILLDAGCNYGFYSFYAASLKMQNKIISLEASKNTSEEFIRNMKLNKFKNIYFMNRAVSNSDNDDIEFNESINDWESSQAHSNFEIKKINNIKSITIDTVLLKYDLNNHRILIKLDIEGNEINAIEGSLNTIKNFSPLIIMEFSKFIFNDQYKIDYLRNFLSIYDYSIYDTKNKKRNLDEVLMQLNNLRDKHQTIGNFYLIKNFSENLNIFLSDE